jgi:hypothetical protein
MTTRFNAKDEVNYGVPGIKTGYDGLKSDFFIPPCGIEDVDVSLFNLFDKEIQPMVGGQDSSESKKVPVIFAAGEKWALLKKGKPVRDRSNTLILPLITIMRQQITQESNTDITGRGINQQTGEIVIRRRLDKSDRDYQNLINRLFIENQTNVAVNPDDKPQVENQLTTDRKVGENRNDYSVKRGGLLQANRKNNIYETLVIPSPQFFTVNYEVTVWTQYMQHTNQIIEKIMSSFLPQAKSWKLTTPKGYWFIAKVEQGAFETESSFDDMSSAERFIKVRFSIQVPAYVWASSAPGVPVPVKRYVSSPIINFEVTSNRTAVDGVPGESEEFTNNFVLGSDDPTLPLDDQVNTRDDQRKPGWKPQVVQPINSDQSIDANDPVLSTYPRGRGPYPYKKIQIGGQTKYVRIVNVNASSGETVYSASDLEGLKIIPVDRS